MALPLPDRNRSTVKIRIILVDGHALMREGLRSLLEKESDIEVVGEAEDGRRALAVASATAHDVVLTEVHMPNLNGIDATRQILATSPQTKVIALSGSSDERDVDDMLRAGARGFVMKESSSQELLQAVRAAARGEAYLSPRITGQLTDRLRGGVNFLHASPREVLVGREREILQLIAEGKSSRAIASVLHISVSTVEGHRRNLMKKLGLHSIAELTKYAIREGLTSPKS